MTLLERRILLLESKMSELEELSNILPEDNLARQISVTEELIKIRKDLLKLYEAVLVLYF